MKSEQNIVYIAGMAVQYNRKYPGNPVIVFLHDSLGSIELWRDLPLRISGALQCNTLVYDRLGHGIAHPMPSPLRTAEYLEKEADTLSELLEELGIDNAILLGHSDGGSIALIAAAKYPDKIKAVICEAAHIFVEEITLNGIEEAINAYQNTNLPDRLAKYHGDKVDTLFRA
ncbi:alpha/beta fold hydrolase [Sphingobacterium sp. HSC-15S19]|uniref:alpha/beta fold hydrolase n=1 Tax=Sphingobacterium TaxID=28453 RepID=UPI003D193D94